MAGPPLPRDGLRLGLTGIGWVVACLLAASLSPMDGLRLDRALTVAGWTMIITPRTLQAGTTARIVDIGIWCLTDLFETPPQLHLFFGRAFIHWAAALALPRHQQGMGV